MGEGGLRGDEMRVRAGGETYEGRRDWHGPPLIPRLHHRRIDAFDGAGQRVEIAGQKSMQGKRSMQNIKKLHQPCRYIFRHRQIACER